MSLSDRLASLGPREPRILTVDIETAPATVLVFDLATDYINPSNVIEPSRVLCFAAKWLGESSVMFYGEDTLTRRQLVEAAWNLLDEADLCVTYNGRRFDIPHLQREMVQLGYRPPSPWIDVDLLPVMRSRFKFMSNRLGFITEQLGLDTKADAGGMDTWRKVMAGDEAAWRTFRKYNMQDVRITEDLFTYLRPWLKLPHAGLFTGRMSACAACGSERLTPDGIARTKTNAWLRLACADCGAVNRLLVNGQTRLA